MSALPIVRLEVENMRQTMAIALTNYTIELDEMLQKAINDFCTPSNLRAIIVAETNRTLSKVIEDSVRSWFLSSDDGTKLIKDAVAKKLKEEAELYGA